MVAFAQGEPIAAKMFANMAVTMVWHAQSQHCPPLAIQVSLSAYAVPGNGTQIPLF
jgi:hypothetical protein